MQVDLEQHVASRWRAQSAFSAAQAGMAAIVPPTETADEAADAESVPLPRLQISQQEQRPGPQRLTPRSSRLQSPSPGGAGSGGILQRLGQSCADALSLSYRIF